MDKASIARIISLIVSLLTYFGINVPEDVVEAATGIVFGVLVLWAAYKNNYLFKKGHAQKLELEKKGLN
ncbi:holin, SPP1 family [Thalassobacillus cyri]|uniref:Holin, SPP1 family n=1 Tax=Thalassobacillus cyri TaxID=571932 RepID=A0A1H4C1R3_9BACI|nr:phage holin [Thalassobacillus cyri]SEA54371.1 holin, SPP1 family [Thalassobacillus cyri]